MKYNDEFPDNELKEPALKYNYLSAEDYLELERTSTRNKHELHQGHLVTMQGASIEHNTIVANMLGSIVPHLKGKHCRAFPSDLRVYISTAESFTYPDISIVCDDPDTLDDAYLDTIKNPSVIIEVLSPSTEKYDRGTKFFYYMQIASLKEYFIISSTSLYVQVARKQAQGTWKFEEITDPKASICIQSIQQMLTMAEVYERVGIQGNEE